MRLEWLEDLLAVAETGSFHEAAERRLLTQSAFSRRIQNIEDHIGIELFDRTRKPVQLRPTMAHKHDQIQRLAMELRQLEVDLRLDARVASNHIVIASQHALTTTMTPQLVKRMRHENQAIHARLRSANLDECFGLLLSRQADIAIVYRVPGEDHPVSAGYVESNMIGSDRLIPVSDPASAAQLREKGTQATLHYIAYPGDVFFGRVMGRQILSRLSEKIRTIPIAETALTLAALEMAMIGIGVAWVPHTLARPRIQDGSISDLSDIFQATSLDIMAVRLSGSSGPITNAVWSGFANMP